jgi:uncharacterized protein with HEPN domain
MTLAEALFGTDTAPIVSGAMTGPSPESAKYLSDARRASQTIARFTAGRGFDDCLADDMLRAAVAGRRRSDVSLADTIPDLPRIVAFRNELMHGYATVDDKLVWGVVEREPPVRLATLTRILAEAER